MKFLVKHLFILISLVTKCKPIQITKKKHTKDFNTKGTTFNTACKSHAQIFPGLFLLLYYFE